MITKSNNELDIESRSLLKNKGYLNGKIYSKSSELIALYIKKFFFLCLNFNMFLTKHFREKGGYEFCPFG
jgi:hypothetical protein